MIKLTLALMLLPVFAQAEAFKISGDLYQFRQADGLLIARCEKNCDALKTIKKHKKINFDSLIKKGSFVNSVGSEVCDKVYKGKSLLGVAENQDRRAFCIFKDGSMVEMNSLSEYLTNKKIVK